MKDFLIGTVGAILLVLFVVVLRVYANPPPAASKKPILEYTETNIEGCQYLVSRTYMGFEVLCHKGNCTNHLAARIGKLVDIPEGYYGHPFIGTEPWSGTITPNGKAFILQTNNGIISYSIEN